MAGAAATGFLGWKAEREKVEDLEKEVEALRLQERRSAVDRSVSKQMEELANEQREISDEKREEAIQQTRVANEMRLRSELERQNAIIAERNAVASERKAVEASEIAESQRQMAEHQRLLAEMSKQKADTLSYIALGRSLGSISTIQAQAGNEDVANLLSYASYLYTSRYRGDIYYPAVFQSLMRSSQSVVSWTEHTGAVTNLEYMPGEDHRLVSVSDYGEIILSERQGNNLKTKVLFRNKDFDFRDVIINRTNGCIYAASRSGHLVVVQQDLKTVKVVDLDKIEHPMRLHDISDNNLLIIRYKTQHPTQHPTAELPRYQGLAQKQSAPALRRQGQDAPGDGTRQHQHGERACTGHRDRLLRIEKHRHRSLRHERWHHLAHLQGRETATAVRSPVAYLKDETQRPTPLFCQLRR